MKFYTIGYGNRKSEEFLNLMKEKDIKAVVDVRLRSDHAHLRCYAKAKYPDKGIESLLKSAGVGYFHLVELGNIFLDYEDWADRYKQLLKLAGDLLIRKLDQIPTPFCLLCAEKYVAECHRGLIAEYLEEKGYTTEHLGETNEFPEKRERRTISRTYITSIKHYLDETGDIAEEVLISTPAYKMAIFLTDIVNASTRKFPANEILTTVQCKRRECHGDIIVWSTDIQKDIKWECEECGDNGSINNWQGTKWDNTKKFA